MTLQKPLKEQFIFKCVTWFYSTLICVKVIPFITQKYNLFLKENTPENIDMKKKIFGNLDNLVTNEHTIIASSTSCIVPSRFTEKLEHRKQCIVAHPVS